MKILNYDFGKAKEIVCRQNRATIEVVLSDERRVQLCVDDDGSINLRGWGNDPKKLGNSNSIEMRCQLIAEVPHENWKERYGF